LVVGLQFLAGHTQSSYICLAGSGVYALVSLVTELRQRFSTGYVGETSKSPSEKFVVTTSVVPKATKVATMTALIAVRHLGTLFLMIALGLGLAAVQLLPTWELSRLSVRAGGLPYREAASFSLKPRLLAYTLLPPFGVDLSQVFGSEAFTEFVAYLGILPLLLAGLGVLYGRNPRKAALVILTGLGLFLALGGYNPVYYLLYKVVPGISLFRAPARWMLLYAFGGAMLAGVGVERIASQRVSESANRQIENRKSPLWRRIWLPTCFALTCLELFIAGRALPYNHPTAPQALTSLRTAPAHILAAEQGGEPYRFLSMSGITYDPGDLAEIQQMFAGQLPERAIYDYVVAAKRKEILAPNLPLLYRIPSVDGYDGGALPLRRYVTLQRLFLPAEKLSADGRLREQLTQVPPARLLALLNVKYVITDKVYDVWIDNVFYDLEFRAVLGTDAAPEVIVSDPPPLAATSLGLVSYLEGGGNLPDGTPVAEVLVTDASGHEQRHVLRAGTDTAEGLYTGNEAHQQARVGHHWRDNPAGNDYITRLELGPAVILRQIAIRYLTPGGRLHVRGLSLIDARTGASEPVIVSTSGRFRLVHSGDVKIYENLDNLPRAFLVHRARVVEDDETALTAMADPGFDPGQEVLLAAETGWEMSALSATGMSPDRVRIAVYSAERVVIEVDTEREGYLVLTDACYPGWQAMLDGQPVSIRRADVLFRAVRVPAGSHTIEFRYRPRTFQVGVAISLLTLVGMVIGTLRISIC